MALRVLLADESSTIKKVIQLALQDFGVEVKSVHSGVDVLEVAKSFKPDLIFADVLLQKRNGYEACAELKAAFETREIPVVLMWSSFMELDESAYQRAHANGRLEKPFDADALRSLVTDLVAKARSSTIAHHLEFPKSAFPREEAAPRSTVQAAPSAPQASAQQPPAPPASNAAPVIPPAARAPEQPRVFELEADDAADSAFQFSELPKNPPVVPTPERLAPQMPSRNWEDITMPKSDDSENWSHQNLQQFNVNLEPLKIESDNVSIEFNVQHGELEGEKRLLPHETVQHPAPAPAPNDQTVSRTGYLTAHTQTEARSVLDSYELPQTQIGSEGLSVLSSFESEEMPEMQISRRPSPLDPAPQAFEERRSNSVPQLSADELERIVRAQSREIIEDLVRKIVPDLASQMIRDELQRLTNENP